MNKPQQIPKKEQYSPTYEEICEYIKSKNIDLQKEDIIHTIDDGTCIYELTPDNKICGLVIYETLPNKSGHHIYFFGADNSKARKNIILKGLQFKCWPKSALRKGKQVIYKRPEVLIKRFLTK